MNVTIKSKILSFITIWGVSIVGLPLLLSGCGQESGTNSLLGSFTLDVPVAYVKRPIDSSEEDEQPNPQDAITLKPGGNLYIREFADPISPEYNVTASFTAPIFDDNGDLVKGAGDVAGVDVSTDGSKIVFAMHRGVYEDGVTPSTWNLYEYIIPENGDFANPSNIRSVIPSFSSIDRELYNDFNPVYLPDDRIVFVSDRMLSGRLINAGDFDGLDGNYETEDRDHTLVNIHIMRSGDFTSLKQLTFNQSHDLNPSILSSGEIMYVRWDNAYRGNDETNKNVFSVYKVNPDGTGMDVLYGTHSHDPANSAPVFLYPRQMQNGNIVAVAMPQSGTYKGGDLIQIDHRNFSDIDVKKVNASSSSSVGQGSLSNGEVPRTEGISLKGRYTTPFPLWDDSNRMLVAWAPCEVVDQMGQREFCNKDGIDYGNPDVYQPAAPQYGIWMYDPGANTKKMIILREAGMTITDPVAVIDRYSLRNDPIVKEDTVLDDRLDANVGMINIRSVYDTTSLATIGMDNFNLPTFQQTVNGQARTVVDLAAVQQLPINQRAAFIRIIRPAPVVEVDDNRVNNAHRLVEIIGYHRVEPDGSVIATVPADTPFAIEVLDSWGRKFKNHSGWLQLKQGETYQCNGCHSHRDDSGPLNSGLQSAGMFPGAVNGSILGEEGETMAEALDRVSCSNDNCAYRKLSANLTYFNEWQNPGGTTPAVDLNYTDLVDVTIPVKQGGNLVGDSETNFTTLACGTNWDINTCRITIDYELHIQDLWERVRPADIAIGMLQDYSCVTCHKEEETVLGVTQIAIPDGQLNLTQTGQHQIRVDNTNVYDSFLELARGDGILIVNVTVDNNNQEIRTFEYVTEPEDPNDPNNTNRVLVGLGQCGNYVADPRKCGRGNTIANSEINRNIGRFLNKMINGIQGEAQPHVGMMSDAEFRLIVEWQDTGKRYRHDPTPPAN